MPFSIPKRSQSRSPSQKKSSRRDISVGIAFVSAIAILLLAAGYVISRLSSDKAYRDKWKDYNDCGWA